MDITRTPHLPKLDSANYATWYFALESYAASIDATEHLKSDPAPPTDPAFLRSHTQKQISLLTAILSSVPTAVLGLLSVPGCRPTLHKLIKDIIITPTNPRRKITSSWRQSREYSVHRGHTNRRLHSTARIRPTKNDCSKIPAISDEKTTVDFIITGLQKIPALAPIIGNLITSKPMTIKDFIRKYKALQNIYQPVHGPTPTPPTINYRMTPQPTFVHEYGHNLQYRRPYRVLYRRQCFGTTRQQPPHQNPCSFHTSLGISAQHTDEECRGPRDPKNSNVKPQAHFVQTPMPYMWQYDLQVRRSMYTSHVYSGRCWQPLLMAL